MGLLQDLHGTIMYHSPFVTLGGLASRYTLPSARRIFGSSFCGTTLIDPTREDAFSRRTRAGHDLRVAIKRRVLVRSLRAPTASVQFMSACSMASTAAPSSCTTTMPSAASA